MKSLPSEVFAEGEKKGCYPFFDGFRQPTPDCSGPNGDGRIPVSMNLPLFTKSGRGVGSPHERRQKNSFSTGISWNPFEKGIPNLRKLQKRFSTNIVGIGIFNPSGGSFSVPFFKKEQTKSNFFKKRQGGALLPPYLFFQKNCGTMTESDRK